MPGFRQGRGGQRETHANTRARNGTSGAHLYDMRVIFAVMALTAAWFSASVFPSGSTAVQPLTVTWGSGTTKATCTLIHRDDRPDGVVLYFVTAGQVFKTADGDCLP
jgi:hypothetical protein